MFVVGIAKLSGDLQAEIPLLGKDLGMTAYDARMLLAPGIPALVLITAEKSKALALLANLRNRGHDALAFDSSAVVSSQDMITPRDVTLEPDAFVVTPRDVTSPPGLRGHRGDVASHPRDPGRVVEVDEQAQVQRRARHAHRRAGGDQEGDQTNFSSRAYDKHEVLYIYQRGGAPWLLRDTGTRYEGLGERLATTERANFLTAVDILHKGAPHAVYDESLVGRKIPDRLSQVAIQGIGTSATRVESSTDAAMDVLCHFVAMWHAKRQG